MIQNHPEARAELDQTSSDAVPVVLLSPYMAEGTVVFHQNQGQPGTRGDFFPGRTKVSIAENTRCELLLAKSRIVLIVKMSPAPATSKVEHFPFEIDAWEPLEQPMRNQRGESSSGFDGAAARR